MQLRCHCLQPRAGAEAKDVGIGEHLALDIAEQAIERCVLVEIMAAIDDSVADPVLQRDAPLPAGVMGHRTGDTGLPVRHSRSAARLLNRTAASGSSRHGQPASVWPISSARKPVQSRNRSPSIRVPLSSTSVAMFAALAVELDIGDLAFDALRAVRLGHLAQELGVKRRIELVGIVHAIVRQMRELALARRDQLQAIIVIRLIMPLRKAVQPEMLEAGGPMILARQAERMEVALADILPVVEHDAELEGRLGRPHELGFVDAEQAVVRDERRNGGFADADRADRVGLDERDVDDLAQRSRDRSGGHPACGAAARNDDPAQPLAHRLSCRRRKARMRDARSRVHGSRARCVHPRGYARPPHRRHRTRNNRTARASAPSGPREGRGSRGSRG